MIKNTTNTKYRTINATDTLLIVLVGALDLPDAFLYRQYVFIIFSVIHIKMYIPILSNQLVVSIKWKKVLKYVKVNQSFPILYL